MEDVESGCPECAAYVSGQPTKHKFKCILCDHGGSTEHYEKDASMEELAGAIIGFKLCTKHAWELEAIRTKRETEALNKGAST